MLYYYRHHTSVEYSTAVSLNLLATYMIVFFSDGVGSYNHVVYFWYIFVMITDLGYIILL